LSLRLTILGSSGALPVAGRFTTAQLLVIQNRSYLIDCGEGTQMQMTNLQLSPFKIDAIFISHLHGDHYLGLLPLLFSLHLHKREAELHLYGPVGLDEIITLQLKYAKSVLHYPLVFHPVDPGTSQPIMEDDVVTVSTIPLDHKLACAGFLFQEKTKPRRINKPHLVDGLQPQQMAALKAGHDVVDAAGNVLYRNEDLTLPPRPSLSYAFCSDTAWHPAIADKIRGVDLLYHEATFLHADLHKAIETRHSTAAQAGEMAQLAQVKKLIIGHFSARYKDLNVLLQEARTHFANTELALEGTDFVLTD